MRVLREKQKTIIWVVSIVIIPSFILLWGGGMTAMTSGQGVPIAEVGGKTVTNVDFFQFRKRLQAVLGQYRTLRFLGLPEEDPDGTVGFLVARALIGEAEHAGFQVPPNEVGTFIRARREFHDNPFGGSFSEKKYRDWLEDRKLTGEEYTRGIREWLLLQRYLDVVDRTALVTPETTYLRYAQRNATLTYKKVAVPAAPFEDEAESAILPEGGSEEAVLPLLQDYLAEHREEKRWWTLPEWRFEYVLAPFEVPGLEPEVSAKEVREHYDMNKAEYDEKSFEEVRETIRAKLILERKKAIAVHTIKAEVDPYANRKLAAGEPLDLEAMVREPVLAKRNVVTGDSGATPRTMLELKGVPRVGDSTDLSLYLDQLGSMEDAEARQKRIDLLRETLDSRPEPMACEEGVFRIRLLENGYVEPQPKPLEAIRAEVLLEVIKEKARTLAREKAETLAAAVRSGHPGDATWTQEKAGFWGVPKEIQGAALGEPVLRDTPEGTEVLVLVERNFPSREDFFAASPMERQQLRQNVERSLQGDIVPRGDIFVVPGPRLSLWIEEAFREGRIRLLYRREKRDEAPASN